MTIADARKLEKKKEKPNDEILVKQEDALSSYLQSLLEVPVVTELENEKDEEKTDLKSALPIFESVPRQIDKSISGLTPELIPESAPVPVAVPVLKSVPDVKLADPIPQPQLKKPKSMPDWATDEIKCLSAQVSGLTILIPAEFVESIQNVSNSLKPSAKMPVWLYELPDDEDDPVQIVNVKKLVFGGVKSHKIEPDARTYAILLDDGAWGISCDSIGKVISLKSSEITWRGQSGKRRWLAGTLTGTLTGNPGVHGAIVLDVKKIEKALIS